MAAVGYDRSQPNRSPLHKMRGLLHGLTERTGARIARLPALWYHWVWPTALRAEESWVDRAVIFHLKARLHRTDWESPRP